MRYNYVFFDTGAIKDKKNDSDNYYYICTEDLRQMDGVKVVSYPMDWGPYFYHRLSTIQNVANLPFKSFWYPLYFKEDFKERKPICFIIYGYYIRPNYLRYLRRKYPDCKIVKIHRDLIDNWRKRNPDFTDEDMVSLFDLTLTYDEGESKKYSIPYFTEIESKTAIDMDNIAIQSDLFFAGNAKDRLPILLKIYDHAIKENLKCDFFLTGVREEDRIERDGIIYADRGMSYRDMLNRTMSSNCILEINQGGAVGYTSRFLEAVIYGKKLLTNNLSIMDSKFFKPEYIQCFGQPEEIEYDFIRNNTGPIDYHYNNEFSPINLINQIEELLTNE